MGKYIALLGIVFLTSAHAAEDHSQCINCHVSGVNNFEQANAPLIQNLPQLCIACHQQRIDDGEHIINVVPRLAIPHQLPLVDGQVSCTSCHDAHSQQPMQLRMDAAKLCLDCHQK